MCNCQHACFAVVGGGVRLMRIEYQVRSLSSNEHPFRISGMTGTIMVYRTPGPYRMARETTKNPVVGPNSA